MKKLLACFTIISLGYIQVCFSQSVSIHCDKTSPQQVYAAAAIEKALVKKGYSVNGSATTYTINLAVDTKQLSQESFTIAVAGKTITITGSDERGLIYGSLSLAEDIRNGTALKNCKPKNEKPFLPFRAIKYDLPWDTYRHSYALELHSPTCRDTSYWRSFLDMMAENRFNSLTLWNLHPYTFLIKPKNFPEASPWNDAAMKEWQTLFHSITRMAQERAVDVYIVPFNIFVTPEFAKAHNVAMDNLGHDYFVRGDTSEIIKRYTRECVTQMLNEYPGITGMGLTLGEGMAGMTPQQREDWMKESIIEGMRLANRKSKLIHRIPFSSTTGSLGITSIETEKLTRTGIEKEAAMGFTEGPIWADLKFNWSHAHSTIKLVKVHGGKLYDTYFKPEPTDYKIVWTARNEDFFCLRWGVPSFISSHIVFNKRSYSGGYIIGSETYIPAKDYFT
ncbi:MAG TPA: glycoside hydrolase family 20 zincin-like fold domain-containing protein, partial [Chitinophagaceae bacterium]